MMRAEQGVLLPMTVKPVGQGVTGAQHATVHIAGVAHRCIVKKVGDREIAAECFCAILGARLSLPTLIPIVVTDPTDQSFWFGARNIGYPNLATQIGFANKKITRSQLLILTNILSKWVQIGSAISFDELISNGDRNPGNVLWNGTVFTLIDHEKAAGNFPMDLNKLAYFATQQMKEPQISTILHGTTAAAMSQQAMMNAGENILSEIGTEFKNLPPSISRYFSDFQVLVESNVPSLVASASNAVSPLFAGEKK